MIESADQNTRQNNNILLQEFTRTARATLFVEERLRLFNWQISRCVGGAVVPVAEWTLTERVGERARDRVCGQSEFDRTGGEMERKE